MTRHKEGFTLIELLVVLAIIAILAAVIAPNAFRAIEKAKIAKAVSEFKALKTGVLAFYSDTGTWPITASGWRRVEDSGLLRNTDGWPGWDGPYLETNIAMHPWGGIYWLEIFNLVGGPQADFTVEFNDICYAGPGGRGACGLPLGSAQQIDQMVDDGNLSSGDFRRWSGYGDTFWVVERDLF